MFDMKKQPSPAAIIHSHTAIHMVKGGINSRASRRIPELPCDELIRIVDIILATWALLFMAPLMIFIVCCQIVLNPGPIFFIHSRVGRYGQMFPCIKFRTMVPNAEQKLAEILASDAMKRHAWDRDQKLDNDPRITLFGALLRKSSLDELPQLCNVLRGEMSLVGPRPITVAEVSRYGYRFKSYSSVRPGITGLWQVSGRSEVQYRRRVALDVTYVRRRSVKLYSRILIGTIPAVLMARGSC